MDGFQLQTSAFKTEERRATAVALSRSTTSSRGSARRKQKRVQAETPGFEPDLILQGESETVQVELKATAGAPEVVIRVFSGGDEEWEPVAGETLRFGVEVLLQRESRLERTAERFGMKVEALLRSLEQSVVDMSDASAGIPEAEREALAAAGISLEGSAEDPTGAGEVLRGLARSVQFREDALTVPETAKLLGKTEGRIRQMISAGHLVTLSSGEAGYLLPAWQFVNDRPVPGLAAALKSVGDVHPLTIAGFMTEPDVDLELDGRPVSPIEWLLSGGDPGPVADLTIGLSIRS